MSRGAVVVPVDFEEASTRAIAIAKEIAPKLGAEIVLVHVYDFPIYAYPGIEPIVMPGIQLEVQQAAERALDELARGTSMGTVLRMGDAATEILAVIDELTPELVVMGTHGRRGFVHFLLGSVAEKIVQRSAAPVMTVRAVIAPRPAHEGERLGALVLRELCRPPNLMSLVRIPLAVAFPFVAGSPPLAIAVLVAAGVSDVLDGWLARRAHHASVVGQIIDPVADKAFAISAVVTLVVRAALPLWALPILFAREIAEAPLAFHALSSSRRREARVARARANTSGKIDTIVQFATLLVAIAEPRALRPMLVLAAVTGITAAASYGLRELRGRADPRAP